MERQIKYWIFEFQFSEEKKRALDRLLEQYNMTYDEIFSLALKKLIEQPSEFASLFREYQERGESDEGIKFLREYPVYEGETDEEARDRSIKAEKFLAFSQTDLT